MHFSGIGLSTLLCLGATQAYLVAPSDVLERSTPVQLRDDDAAMASSSGALPTPTRYVVQNDDNGNSFFSTIVSDQVGVSLSLGSAQARLVYTNDRAPAEISNTTDIKEYEADNKNSPALIRQDGGANVWFIDTPPNTVSPLHRTISIDYVIQVVGTSILTTSDKDTRTLRPGDMAIQRATLHSWTNPSSTEWSRLMAVMTEVQPVVTKNNGTLQATGF